jgi:uncharacterized LabA/DUF88 family protein
MNIIPKIKKERVAIYIDGSNFYKYLKDEEIGFPKGIKFNYNKFVEFLTRGRVCVSKRYYVGIARNLDNTQKSEQIVKGQQKFLSKLENDGFSIKRGRIIYDKGKIREKGTDVKIAVDLVIGAVDNLYDTSILVSSDTDLIPAIKYIKYKEKKFEYVGFSHNPSFGMQKYADFSRLLLQEDIERFKEKILL